MTTTAGCATLKSPVADRGVCGCWLPAATGMPIAAPKGHKASRSFSSTLLQTSYVSAPAARNGTDGIIVLTRARAFFVLLRISRTRMELAKQTRPPEPLVPVSALD
jgi:hypothetical protein